MKNNLHTILNPKSVAVIGASERKGIPGGEIFHNLLRDKFTGVLYLQTVRPNGGGGLTPLLDRDGKPMVDLDGRGG